MSPIYELNLQIIQSKQYCYKKFFQPVRTKALRQKCLLHLGPFIWNGLSDDAKLSSSVNTFKHQVKKRFLTLLRAKDQDVYVYYG